MGTDELDQIEEAYSSKLEKVDTEFLEKLKNANKSERSEIEEGLKEKLSQLQKEYEKKVSVFLKKHKSFGDEKDEDKIKKESEKTKDGLDMSKPFNPKGVNLGLGAREIIKEKWALFKFKERIKVKRLWEKFVPNFLKVFFIKVNFFLKALWNKSRDMISNFLSWVLGGISNLWKSIKEFLKKVVSFFEKVGSFASTIKNKIFKKNSEKDVEVKEESSELEEKKEGSENSAQESS